MPTLPELISQYTATLKTEGLADEAYKWELLKKQKGRPQLGAVDYGKEVRNLDYSNLIYGPTSLASLREIAEHEPEGLRAAHRKLFDETVDLSDRLAVYREEANALFAMHRDDDRNAGQDERTAATILFFYDSSRYTLYKNSVYQKFCELLEVKSVSAGRKYAHYLDLLRVFAKEHILNNNELQNTYRDLRSDIDELDPNRLLLSQDILYRMLEQKKDTKTTSKQVWIYAPGRGAINWENNQKEGEMTIGWDFLGDLSQYQSQKEISNRITELGQSEKQPMNKSKACWNFCTDIEQGALVVAKSGKSELLGIGRVTSNYLYEPERDQYRHVRKIDWQKTGSWLFTSHDLPLKTLTEWTNYPDSVNVLLTLLEDKTSNSTHTMNTHPLNQILFGPPGTGKTYTTRKMAVQVCDGTAPADRNELKKRYKELVAEKRIAFTTFHQSMSYEDFVEGIKPDLSQTDGAINYIIENGIFKRICIRSQTDEGRGFLKAFEAFTASVPDGERVSIKRRDGRPFEVEVNTRGNLRGYPTVGGEKPSIHLNRFRIDEQLVGEDFYNAWNVYVDGVVDHLEEHFGYVGSKQIATPASSVADRNDVKPHVLIIDEINRGNTPAIFGELITLLEEDKRLGNDEELTVTLPYSKEPFGVPNNLYVIGTMNTADRSVEALDAALRRRFEFKEVGPNPDVLIEYGQSDHGNILLDDGSKLHLPDFLRLLNQRITALRDRDHTIGHAPFFKVHDGLSLGRVLAKNVIPLLQEYFYGDDTQLARLLGKGLVEEITDAVTFATTDGDDPDLPKRYRIKDPSVKGFGLADALRLGSFKTT